MRIIGSNQGKIHSISVNAFRMLIIENVTNRRKELGKSQADIAKRLNISSAAYNKLESGKTKLSDERLHEFSEVLEISLNELLGLDQIISSKAHSRIMNLEAELIKAKNKIKELELFNNLLQKQVNDED